MRCSPGLRSPRVGGNPNNGGNDGPFYWNANNAPTNGNWNYVGRLIYCIISAAFLSPFFAAVHSFCVA